MGEGSFWLNAMKNMRLLFRIIDADTRSCRIGFRITDADTRSCRIANPAVRTNPAVRRLAVLSFFLLFIVSFSSAQVTKPGTRWWLLGSAVDHDNLCWNLSEYARAGIGTVEVTPLYGVQGNESHEIPFLSPRWMEMLRDIETIAAENHLQVDMNCGTGWPFGGPDVPLEEAACKAVFVDTLIHARRVDASKVVLPVPEKERPYARLLCQRAYPADEPDTWRVIALYQSRTRQKVKRAAPGGEGWVLDHFDRTAVRHYLDRFDRAFTASGVAYPHTFFNDSYEVYGANWTPTLLGEFRIRRGYSLEDYLPELLGCRDDGGRVLADYRETLSDLLYENFTRQWVAWAHGHGVSVRNQAHGSPANLLDLYAAVDIPEIEGFGLSDFGIRGLRVDSGMTRRNYSDVSMLKYASSAAHVTGKPLTSSETFTWLTEHFRTSLSQMKPDLDLMFTCGVNRVFFHGSCYTPKDDSWPGWKFYASVDMSPTNSIWRDAPFLMQYIERCQSLLQSGRPDNDFLVYLPVRDMWLRRLKGGEKGLLMQFDIHSMNEKSPGFIRTILTIDSLGYDCDYISDRQLANVRVEGGRLVTEGGTRYRALIIPRGTTLTPQLSRLLSPLSAYVITEESPDEMAQFAPSEPMRKELGLRAIRRATDDGGFCYFIANLTPRDVCARVPLTVDGADAAWYDPMTGDTLPADIVDDKVLISLRSGESRFLLTSGRGSSIKSQTGGIKSRIGRMTSPVPSRKKTPEARPPKQLSGLWSLSFLESAPRVDRTFLLDSLQTWEQLDDDSVRVTMGTGVYATRVKLNRREAEEYRWIDLGDVRESARVYINGHFIGCAWAVPFVLDCRNTLRRGWNEIRIEVTNLPANRIADMDRRGIPWRKMRDINVVDINYRPTTYEHWKPVPSGLHSAVWLKPSP